MRKLMLAAMLLVGACGADLEDVLGGLADDDSSLVGAGAVSVQVTDWSYDIGLHVTIYNGTKQTLAGVLLMVAAQPSGQLFTCRPNPYCLVTGPFTPGTAVDAVLDGTLPGDATGQTLQASVVGFRAVKGQ